LASGVVPLPIKKGKEYPTLVEKAEKTTVSSFTVGCSRRRSKKKKNLNRSWPEDNARSGKCKGRAARGRLRGMNEDDGGWKMEEGWKYGKKQRVKERSRIGGGTRMQPKVSERLAGASGRTATGAPGQGPQHP
jgi:hypothetical protein